MSRNPVADMMRLIVLMHCLIIEGFGSVLVTCWLAHNLHHPWHPRLALITLVAGLAVGFWLMGRIRRLIGQHDTTPTNPSALPSGSPIAAIDAVQEEYPTDQAAVTEPMTEVPVEKVDRSDVERFASLLARAQAVPETAGEAMVAAIDEEMKSTPVKP
jgi:hypothetical protein